LDEIGNACLRGDLKKLSRGALIEEMDWRVGNAASSVLWSEAIRPRGDQENANIEMFQPL
jgi:hypothetical protein